MVRFDALECRSGCEGRRYSHCKCGIGKAMSNILATALCVHSPRRSHRSRGPGPDAGVFPETREPRVSATFAASERQIPVVPAYVPQALSLGTTRQGWGTEARRRKDHPFTR